MLRPILDIDILSQRHEAIEALVMPRNAEIVAQIQRELRGVKDIDKCEHLASADSEPFIGFTYYDFPGC